MVTAISINGAVTQNGGSNAGKQYASTSRYVIARVYELSRRVTSGLVKKAGTHIKQVQMECQSMDGLQLGLRMGMHSLLVPILCQL